MSAAGYELTDAGQEMLGAHCIACGCTYGHPCPGGCSWAAYNWRTQEALCTSCAALPIDRLEAMTLGLGAGRVAIRGARS